MVSIRELASSHETVTDLRAQVAEAEAAAAKAFRAALTDGWAPEELRGLGFEEPSKPRRRSRRTRATKAADDVSQEEQAPSEQA